MTRHWEQVNSDKVFANGDDGIIWEATDEVEFTIPVNDFQIGDSLLIFRVTSNLVNVKADSGVTINSIGLKITNNGFATFIKVEENRWLGWGNLYE